VSAAVPRIVSSLAAHGVRNVLWFLAYDGHPLIWLVTDTDEERGSVAEHGFFRAEVLSALTDSGLAPELVHHTGITVQSQESVDRDWDGNWRHAMQ